jgi:lipoprotein signal peptidase
MLPLAPALQLYVAWWMLGVTNFVLVHAVWVCQRKQEVINTTPFKCALIAFGALGNLSFFMWERQLLAAF